MISSKVTQHPLAAKCLMMVQKNEFSAQPTHVALMMLHKTTEETQNVKETPNERDTFARQIVPTRIIL